MVKNHGVHLVVALATFVLLSSTWGQSAGQPNQMASNTSEFSAWKDDYLSRFVDASYAEQERLALREKYQRYAELVDRDTGDLVSDLGSSDNRSELREYSEGRAEELLKALGLALSSRHADQVLENAQLLEDGDTSRQLELTVLARMVSGQNQGRSDRNLVPDGRLRPAIRDLNSLARSKVPAVRLQALNSLAIAHCLQGEKDKANDLLVEARKTASELRLTTGDRLALRLNSDIWGCDGGMAARNAQAAQYGSGMSQMAAMQQFLGGITGGIETVYNEARANLPAYHPVVLQSAILHGFLIAQSRKGTAGARQQLEELWHEAQGDGDPLYTSLLLFVVASMSYELNDISEAAYYLDNAERAAAPVIQQYAGEAPRDDATPDVALDPSTVAMLEMLRANGDPDSAALVEFLKKTAAIQNDSSMNRVERYAEAKKLAEELSQRTGIDLPSMPQSMPVTSASTPEEVLASEPADAAAAIDYYLERLWSTYNSRRLGAAVLTGADSLSDLYAYYERVFAALLLGYPPAVSQATLEVSELMDTLVQKNLVALSFAEQLAFVTGYLPTQTSVVLSGAKDFDLGDSNLEHIIGWKGMLALASRKQNDVIQEALQVSAFRADAERLLEIRRIMSAATITGTIPAAELDTLTREKELIERRLNARFSEPIANEEQVGLERLRGAIRRMEVFVDLYRFDRYRDMVFEATEYAALIIHSDRSVQVVDLGSAESIDQAIADWRLAAIGGLQDTADKWTRLRDLVWVPLANAALLSEHRVLLAPDSELSRVPWHLFHTDGELTQVDSARALIASRTAGASINNDRVLLVGGVDFGDGPLGLSTLEGSGDEVRELSSLANNASLGATVLTGNEATETKVVAHIEDAAWVHIATHGFFSSSTLSRASSRDFGPTSSRGLDNMELTSRNPMMNSGLVFAGANNISTQSTDGYLSAEEMLGLDLGGSELVVLSACNTGQGLETTGQGVIGLRSALTAAGARGVLLSIWDVDDAATMEFMQRFYTGIWRNGLTRQASLTNAQEELKAMPAYSDPYYWAAWVLVDGR